MKQLELWKAYIPRVDDYVRWKSVDSDLAGWVYFVDESYFTLEITVRPKPKCQYTEIEKHNYIHTLVVCYTRYWNELEYVYTRKNKYGKTLEDMEIFVREF